LRDDLEALGMIAKDRPGDRCAALPTDEGRECTRDAKSLEQPTRGLAREQQYHEWHCRQEVGRLIGKRDVERCVNKDDCAKSERLRIHRRRRHGSREFLEEERTGDRGDDASAAEHAPHLDCSAPHHYRPRRVVDRLVRRKK